MKVGKKSFVVVCCGPSPLDRGYQKSGSPRYFESLDSVWEDLPSVSTAMA